MCFTTSYYYVLIWIFMPFNMRSPLLQLHIQIEDCDSWRIYAILNWIPWCVKLSQRCGVLRHKQFCTGQHITGLHYKIINFIVGLAKMKIRHVLPPLLPLSCEKQCWTKFHKTFLRTHCIYCMLLACTYLEHNDAKGNGPRFCTLCTYSIP